MIYRQAIRSAGFVAVAAYCLMVGEATSAATAVTQSTGYHSADVNQDWDFNLTELLRVIQLFNLREYHCQAGTEDNYAPGPGSHDCTPHDVDYLGGANWRISLSELLRVIQFYNLCGYAVDASNEDGFRPVFCSSVEGEGEGEGEGTALEGEGEGEGLTVEGEGEGEGISVEGEGEGDTPTEGEVLKYARVILGDAKGAPGDLVVAQVYLDVLNVAPAALEFDVFFNSNRLSYHGSLVGSIVGDAGKQLTVTPISFGQIRVTVSGGLSTQGMNTGLMAALGFDLFDSTDYGEVYSLYGQNPTMTDALSPDQTALTVIPGSITIYSATPVAPVANFTATPKRGLPGTEIQFRDSSRMGNGDNRSWNWSFGDGGTSTERNPIHVYTKTGLYDVSLTVSSSAGTNQMVSADLIEIVVGSRIYVDKRNASEVEGAVEEGEGSGLDGLTWETAFPTIQAGIDAAFAAGGGEVWVAANTYDEVRVNSAGSLFLREVVHVYGGFSGTETELSQRDWETNETIVDGSVSRNGQAAYHVVVGANNSGIDGFTIRGGRAMVVGTSATTQQGGGMYNPNVSVAIDNCLFTDNSSQGVGGGVYNGNGTPRFNACRFVENSVVNIGNPNGYAYGGAMYNSDSRVTLSKCTFEGNRVETTASWSGDDSNVYAYAYGGGLYSYNSTVVIEDCIFTENAAQAESNGNGKLGEVPYGAYAQALGGGVLSWYSAMEITRCSFLDNQAATNSHSMYNKASGGGLYQLKGTLSLTNSIIYSSNSSDFSSSLERAAGLYNDNPESVILSNCTIVGNSTDSNDLDHGGGLFNWYCSPVITNCIFWANSGVGIAGVESVPIVTYCDIQNNMFEGDNNIASNPQFVLINGGDLRLQPNSPCVDSGRDTSGQEFGYVTVDINGQARGYDGSGAVNTDGSNYDRGAYEYRP